LASHSYFFGKWMQGGHKRVEAGPLVGVRKQALLSDGLESLVTTSGPLKLVSREVMHLLSNNLRRAHSGVRPLAYTGRLFANPANPIMQ